MRFEEMNRYHQDLEALFREHQLALLDRNFGEASRRLLAFHEALVRHVRDEETHLLPAYALAVGRKPGATIEIFEGEHRKIEAVLGRLESETALLAASPSPAGLLALIEREAQFKSLFEHHFLREENLLFPALDRALPEPDQERLLALCATRCAPGPVPAVTRTRALSTRMTS